MGNHSIEDSPIPSGFSWHCYLPCGRAYWNCRDRGSISLRAHSPIQPSWRPIPTQSPISLHISSNKHSHSALSTSRTSTRSLIRLHLPYDALDLLVRLLILSNSLDLPIQCSPPPIRTNLRQTTMWWTCKWKSLGVAAGCIHALTLPRMGDLPPQFESSRLGFCSLDPVSPLHLFWLSSTIGSSCFAYFHQGFLLFRLFWILSSWVLLNPICPLHCFNCFSYPRLLLSSVLAYKFFFLLRFSIISPVFPLQRA